MMNKRRAILILLLVIVLGAAIGAFLLWRTNEANKEKIQNTPILPVAQKYQEVSISTDKNIYQEGEAIAIKVKNESGKDVFYLDPGGKFWSVEYFKDGKWERYGLGDGISDFQLTDPEKEIGDQCVFIQFEMPTPNKLAPQSQISIQWDQKICSLGSSSGRGSGGVVEYIGKGKYRISFYYGFDLLDDQIIYESSGNIVHSESFIIK